MGQSYAAAGGHVQGTPTGFLAATFRPVLLKGRMRRSDGDNACGRTGNHGPGAVRQHCDPTACNQGSCRLQEPAGLTRGCVIARHVRQLGMATELGQLDREVGTLLNTGEIQDGTALLVMADEFHVTRRAAGTACCAPYSTRSHATGI